MDLDNFDSKLEHYISLDDSAKNIAISFTNNLKISEVILNQIINLYGKAKIEQHFKDDFFDSSYHAPITGDFEFFISRILYNLSKVKNKSWKILLRKQEKKYAPDIRIVRDGKTLFIVEIKAKAGWIQCFFSPDRYENDLNRFNTGRKPDFNPDDLNERVRKQFNNYHDAYNLPKNNIFLLLPTFALVHRKKYKTDLEQYYDFFEKQSGLPKNNLILLSSNLDLDLSNPKDKILSPTDDFDNFLNYIIENF